MPKDFGPPNKNSAICSRKKKLETSFDAQRALSSQLKNSRHLKLARGGKLQIFSCQCCGGFHIGSRLEMGFDEKGKQRVYRNPQRAQ